jgi:hypothetical protein
MKTLVAFLLAITYSTFAFAVDCKAVKDACAQAEKRQLGLCAKKFSGVELQRCEDRARQELRSCIKDGGCE